jgi:glycosyltransferase involved in cell wall biosynthesis
MGRIRRRPAIATFHESWSWGEWVRLKGALTGAAGALWNRCALALGFDRYIAVSAVTKEQLVQQGVPSDRITIIYNGVDLELMRTVPGAPAERPSVITSVRLIKSKRTDVLVRALAEVRKRLPDVTATIHGEGPERETLGALVTLLQLDRHVTFAPRLPSYQDVLALRKGHQVFCLPSLSEGFGMVVIEAMALGVPVVCTDIPVLREITSDGRGALLFHVDDHHDLANKLCCLFSDDGLRQKLSAEARSHAETFSWTRFAGEAEAVYLEAQSRTCSARAGV